jgi:hypothetical protein
VKLLLQPYWLLLLVLAGCEPAQFKDAKNSVAHDLLDPASAQFRDLRRCDKPNGVEGEVNSKNEMGGYTGFRPFTYVEGIGSAVLSPNVDFAFWEKLRQGCWSDEMMKKVDADPAMISPTISDSELVGEAAPNLARAPKSEPVSEREVRREPIEEAVNMCWQNYCPCDPPQGGPDKFYCDRLKAGLPVDDEQMSLGSGARDARKQMADFEAEHGSFEPNP